MADSFESFSSFELRPSAWTALCKPPAAVPGAVGALRTVGIGGVASIVGVGNAWAGVAGIVGAAHAEPAVGDGAPCWTNSAGDCDWGPSWAWSFTTAAAACDTARVSCSRRTSRGSGATFAGFVVGDKAAVGASPWPKVAGGAEPDPLAGGRLKLAGGVMVDP